MLKDPLIVLVGLIIRAMAKKFKEAFNKFWQDIWVKVEYKKATTQEEQALINLIHVQYGLED
jgi:hypothetical protein